MLLDVGIFLSLVPFEYQLFHMYIVRIPAQEIKTASAPSSTDGTDADVGSANGEVGQVTSIPETGFEEKGIGKLSNSGNVETMSHRRKTVWEVFQCWFYQECVEPLPSFFP